MKISVILVHYNDSELLFKAVQSIVKQNIQTEWEFLITDNSQNFKSDLLEDIKVNFQIFDLGYNAGFSRGVNQGLRNATGNVIMIVNQDAYIEDENSLQKVITKLYTLPDKVIMGCRLLDEENKFQQSIWIDDPGFKREWQQSAINCKINPSWRSKKYKKIESLHSINGYVHRINGAFLIFKKPPNIPDILFDEDFFLYGEDVEWALRIKKIGWKFYHFSDIIVHHIGSASSSDEIIKLSQIEITDWLVIRKLRGKLYLKLFISLLSFNIWLDALLTSRDKQNKSLSTKTKQKKEKIQRLKTEYLSSIFSSKDLFNTLNEYKKS